MPYPYLYKKGVPHQRTVLVPLQKRRAVLAKIEAYCTYVPFRTATLLVTIDLNLSDTRIFKPETEIIAQIETQNRKILLRNLL